MILYIPISVRDDGVHCGGCSQRSHGDGVSDDWCRAFHEDLQTVFTGRHVAAKRCPDCLAQAKEIAPDDELTALRAQVEALRKDAACFKAIEHDFSPMGMDINGNHAWVYRRNLTLKGPTLRDALLKGQG